MSAEPTAPPDVKAHLDEASGIMAALPWKLGDGDKQRRLARGRGSALAHQVAAPLAAG